MTDFLLYDLKVAALIAVFYFCYRLLMERDTLHRLNRVVLLTAISLSLVLPLCIFTWHEVVWMEPLRVVERPELVITELSAPASSQPDGHPWWQLALGVLLMAGIAVRLVFLLLSWVKLQRLIRSGECHRQADGTTLCIVEPPVAPFSWFSTIVISRQDYEETTDTPLPSGGAGGGLVLILLHERSHIRLHHSMDVVFVELVTALQWFNPVVWLLSRDLRTVHEYEADEAVLSEGASMAQYISLLTCKATGIQACVLTNGINTSELKKRVTMMTKPKTHRRWSWLKALYVIPIVAVSLTMTARTVTDYRVLPTAEAEAAATTGDDDPVFEVCDELPRFPGGEAELMQFVAKNMKYPVVAQQHGVTGRVLAQFIVEKDGSISHPTASKVTDPATGHEVVVVDYGPDTTEQQKQDAEGRNAGLQALKDETVRVMKLMPKWQPGKHQGKAVRVKYTIPLTFRLQ